MMRVSSFSSSENCSSPPAEKGLYMHEIGTKKKMKAFFKGGRRHQNDVKIQGFIQKQDSNLMVEVLVEGAQI